MICSPLLRIVDSFEPRRNLGSAGEWEERGNVQFGVEDNRESKVLEDDETDPEGVGASVGMVGKPFVWAGVDSMLCGIAAFAD
jgi:hypothetical protein